MRIEGAYIKNLRNIKYVFVTHNKTVILIFLVIKHVKLIKKNEIKTVCFIIISINQIMFVIK